MATARKLPSGNWNVVVYSHTDENGKRRYVSFTAKTKAEANRLGAEFQANRMNETQPQDITVLDAINRYIESKSNILSARTIREYKVQVKQYAPIANIRLGTLSTSDLQNYVNQLAKTKSAKTVRNLYSLLHSAIEVYCDRNFKVTLPTRKPIDRHIPTDSDVNNLISNANPRLKLAIILGSQGLRRGEICSLKYKDILRDFNAIYIHTDMVLDSDNKWIVKEIPKTSASVRRIILPESVIKMLGTGNDDDLILGVLPSTVTSDFINLRNKLGLQCRFHDLRHYSVSILHAIGLPDAYIMEHNGYQSDAVMKSVYRHALSDKTTHYTSIANDYFEKNVMKEQNNLSNK